MPPGPRGSRHRRLPGCTNETKDTSMTVRKLLLTLSMAVAVPAAFAQTTTSTATRTFRFQPVGLGATETAEVILHNSASNNTNSGTAASCTGSVSFLNAAGTVAGSATTFTLTTGQTSSVNLPFASSGGSGVRTFVIGEVSYTLTSGTPCALSISLETYDTSSGATHVSVAATSVASIGQGNGR